MKFFKKKLKKIILNVIESYLEKEGYSSLVDKVERLEEHVSFESNKIKRLHDNIVSAVDIGIDNKSEQWAICCMQRKDKQPVIWFHDLKGYNIDEVHNFMKKYSKTQYDAPKFVIDRFRGLDF